MNKKIFLPIKIIIIYLFFLNINYAEEFIIIPLKKPILTEIDKAQKLSKNIIQPKPKPRKKTQKSSESIIKPKSKPKNKLTEENPKVKITKKEAVKKKNKIEVSKKIDFLIPKAKPLVVKKETIKTQKTSKYYKRKDFELAIKSIRAFEKGNWSTALSLSKKKHETNLFIILYNGNIY